MIPELEADVSNDTLAVAGLGPSQAVDGLNSLPPTLLAHVDLAAH